MSMTYISQQVLNSPLNNSKSKFQYSFSKSPRFRKLPVNVVPPFYDSTDNRRTRGPSFGYGKKYDFTKSMSIAPEPTNYMIESLFDLNRYHAKGASFGLGRSQVRDNSYLSIQKTPGPGTYNESSQMRSKEKGISIRPKTYMPQMPSFLKHTDESFQQPGPGHYESIETLKRDGRYLISKFKSQGATVLNFTAKRFKSEVFDVPGPGEYEQLATLKDNGAYTISKFKGSGKRFLGRETRKSFIDHAIKTQQFNCNPGPGNYRFYSDFGVQDNPAKLRPLTAETTFQQNLNKRLRVTSQSHISNQ